MAEGKFNIAWAYDALAEKAAALVLRPITITLGTTMIGEHLF